MHCGHVQSSYLLTRFVFGNTRRIRDSSSLISGCLCGTETVRRLRLYLSLTPQLAMGTIEWFALRNTHSIDGRNWDSSDSKILINGSVGDSIKPCLMLCVLRGWQVHDWVWPSVSPAGWSGKGEKYVAHKCTVCMYIVGEGLIRP
jgi:hypothetical protein